MFGAATPHAGAASRMSHLYANVQVQGAEAADRSGHELVALLFDGLLGAIARARGAVKQGDIENKGKAISHAMRIIGEGLRAGLNLREGGQLAKDLNDLYGYIELRLTQANLRNDDAALLECATLLKTLQQAWSEIAPQVRRAA
jgi:flagellar protein FliS